MVSPLGPDLLPLRGPHAASRLRVTNNLAPANANPVNIAEQISTPAPASPAAWVASARVSGGAVS
ncbi:hypothetical protein ACWDKQ_18090 [Saccharopolyspora sp. NPDC000995]